MGRSEVFCLLVCTQELYTNLCLNPRHGASLAPAADLWADTTGLEARFKLVDGGQSALWVHESLSCLAFPDKAGRIRDSEPNVSTSRSASFFTLSSNSLAGFFAPCVSPTETFDVLLCPSKLCFSLFPFKMGPPHSFILSSPIVLYPQ